jgi:pSer/pThr/pTyr-binding forkhead associated (FHA) protein
MHLPTHQRTPRVDPWLIRVVIERAGCPCGDEVFTQPEVVIGRDPASDLPLWCTLVSRRHARLLRSGRSLAIEDLGSFNGLRVNGERVQWALLRPGDLITLGTFGLRVELVQRTARGLSADALRGEDVEDTTEDWGPILRGPHQYRESSQA